MRAVFLMALSVVAVAAEELPPAQTILDKYYLVTGGKNHKAVTYQVTTLSVNFGASGMKGVFKTFAGRPNKSYIIMELEGQGRTERGTTGAVAWELSARGPRIMKGQEAAGFMRDAYLDPADKWKRYEKIDTVGSEKVGDQDCYKILMLPKDGNPETYFYEKNSGFLAQSSKIVNTPSGTQVADTFFSEYRPYGGLLIPTIVRQRFAGGEVVGTVENVEINEEMPPDRFEPPAEVKKLIR